MAKILIIDDYKEIRDIYGETLRNAQYEVETVESADLGVSKILTGGYDLVLLDMLMPVHGGIWVLDQIQVKNLVKSNGKIILMGIESDDENHKYLIRDAMKKGAAGFLDKRISVETELVPKIKEFLP